MLDDVLRTIDADRQESLRGLVEFLSIASISTDAAHADDITRCARWLVERFGEMGLAARIEPTAGLPVVLAGNAHQPGRPTVLYYGHYDVQPPDPLDKWRAPPFAPAIRDGAVYARGAADDKGQVWAHMRAIAAWQRHGGLPVNLVVLLEGEEEIASKNLPAFVRRHRAELAADVALISDSAQFGPGVPAITYATRGLVYLDVDASGADHDLHSGQDGGAVPNAANELVKLLATLHDDQGRVNVPGFYDDVLPLTEEERALWRRLPQDDAAYAASLGLGREQLTGEEGYSTLERQWARPTCDINGLTAGYQGPGAKTVIGATASAKVSFRLVPNQDPQRIADLLARVLRRRCPGTVKLEVRVHSTAAPALVPRDSRAVDLASQAVEIGFGRPPALIRGGGTLPILSTIGAELGIEALLVGFALPDDRIHSPNEKFSLQALHQGTRTAAALYDRLRDLR